MAVATPVMMPRNHGLRTHPAWAAGGR